MRSPDPSKVELCWAYRVVLPIFAVVGKGWLVACLDDLGHITVTDWDTMLRILVAYPGKWVKAGAPVPAVAATAKVIGNKHKHGVVVPVVTPSERSGCLRSRQTNSSLRWIRTNKWFSRPKAAEKAQPSELLH